MTTSEKTLHDIWEAIDSMKEDIKGLAVSMAYAKGEARGIKWLAGIVVTVSGAIVAFVSLWR